MGDTAPTDRRYGLALAGLTALAFALRIAAAQGSLWLDEAWSMTLAHDVGTPAGVLFRINHDNNHHLNSLWLQTVGITAPTWLMRLLSVVAGTLAVPVAAAIARPRGPVFALVAAWLYTVSPILVTMGSEARGYALMALALLVAILFVDRALAGDERYHRPQTLALCFALGALAQLTMVFGVVALIGWAFVTWWRRGSFADAVGRSLRLFAVPLLALALVLGMIAAAAWADPKGFQFGYYEPFRWLLFLHAIVEMVGFTLGFPLVTILLPIAALALLVLAPRLGAARVDFHRLAIFAFPAALAILHSGNPGHPRYYLLAAIALLLLIADVIAGGLEKQGNPRRLAAAALAAMTVGSLVQDIDLAINRRGDPAAAIRTLQRLSPGGATVVLDRPTGRAMLVVAAAQAHYPLRLVTAPCPPQAFVFVDRYKGEIPPATFARCGHTYLPAAERKAHGLSGTHWTLYARAP